jgi:hypothetical protein
MFAGAFHYWEPALGKQENARFRPFLRWGLSGLAFPCFLWLFLNLGVTPVLPPLLTDLAFIRNHGVGFHQAYLSRVGFGLFIIGSSWSMVTFLWLLVDIARRLQERRQLWVIAAIWGLIALPFASLTLLLAGWAGLPIALLLWLIPVVHAAVPLVEVHESPPMYARAVAKMKFGKYNEAEWEVIRELEKAEDDFDGWMLLAELYATQFNDLEEADRTIREVCSQPNTSSVQISLAFHRLADWYLKLRSDPVGARRALTEIARLAPGSHVARMAELRLKQLPSTELEVVEQRQTRKIRLPALRDDAFEQKPVDLSPVEARDCAAQANRCVEKLKADPNDVAARERLAILFAEKLGKVEAGIEQLELLLGIPGQPPEKSAEWLSLIAAWHATRRQDIQSYRGTLERLIRDYSGTSHALFARRRLNLMELEESQPASRAELQQR